MFVTVQNRVLTREHFVRGDQGIKMISATRKKHGKFTKWELVSSNNGRRSFAINHFGKTLTPITMAATRHKSELVFLKYIERQERQRPTSAWQKQG